MSPAEFAIACSHAPDTALQLDQAGFIGCAIVSYNMLWRQSQRTSPCAIAVELLGCHQLGHLRLRGDAVPRNPLRGLPAHTGYVCASFWAER